MKTTASIPHRSRRLAATLLLLVLLFPCVPAALHAQFTKIFVASNGNDANDGSRGSPKRNFQPAHDAVAAGGQIVVLDTAGYGTLNITKSLAVTVPPGVNGFITVTGIGQAVVINAGANAVVSLRGLILEGGAAAIDVNSVGNLSVEDCTLRNALRGIGLFGGNSKLYVYNTTARNCTTGIQLSVSAPTTASVTVNGCRLEQNSSLGLGAASTGSAVDVTMTDCVISGNGTGVTAGGSAAGAVVRVSDSSITANGTGISTNDGGQVLSRGNNTLENNGAGNTFPGAYSAK